MAYHPQTLAHLLNVTDHPGKFALNLVPDTTERFVFRLMLDAILGAHMLTAHLVCPFHSVDDHGIEATALVLCQFLEGHLHGFPVVDGDPETADELSAVAVSVEYQCLRVTSSEG